MKNDKKGGNAIKTQKAAKPNNIEKGGSEVIAIDQAPSSDEESHNDESTCQEIVSAILKSLFGPGVDSANRLPSMLDWIVNYMFDPDITWPVFHEAWTCCDVTWPYCVELEFFFGAALTGCTWAGVEPVDYLHPDDRTAYDELPEQILIYRGCSRSRVKGASWTTDINVAKAFAEGHRGIAVPDPVIASLRVPKSSIIGYYTARKESEVVISPWECQSHPLVVRAFTA